MKKHSSNRAILVLESPWELDEADSNRTSVMPFVDGIAKYAGDTEVFHASFYDESSFKKAFACLCKTKFTNSIVYIAAHGYKRKIGDVDIIKLLSLVGSEARKYNITGVMLGACFVGEHTTALEVCVEESNLKWCAGYASECAWLAGTLMDCSILSEMSSLEKEDYSSSDSLISAFARAISHFSPSCEIGRNYRKKRIALQQSLKIVIQPVGRGKHAKMVSDKVFEKHEKLQIRN